MARKSSRGVPQGRARSKNPACDPLTATRQLSVSAAYSKRQRRQGHLKRQRRRLAFAAQRSKHLESAEIARETLQIILGDGRYTVQWLLSLVPPVRPSPFELGMPVVTPNYKGRVLPNVATTFYNIASQISISQQETTFYSHYSPHLANWRGWKATPPPSKPNTIRFVSKSTLTAARCTTEKISLITSQHPTTSSVGVLSFASAKRPGGGFLHGGNEQEETLARSTSLVASLRSEQAMEFYRTHRHFLKTAGAGLYDHSMVYSPGVVAFRRDDDDGIACQAPSGSSNAIAPYLINVLSSVPVNAAAVRHNHVTTPSDAHAFEESIRETMRDRMTRALHIFDIHGNSTLILGAFGCGSNQNSVEMVAELWAELLVCGTSERGEGGEEETRPAHFKGVFEEIVFAVPGKLFAPFKHAFEMKVLEMEVISALTHND